MTKDKLKDDIIRTICCLNSDISNKDSLIINEQGNPSWGSTAFIPTFENAAYGIES